MTMTGAGGEGGERRLSHRGASGRGAVHSQTAGRHQTKAAGPSSRGQHEDHADTHYAGGGGGGHVVSGGFVVRGPRGGAESSPKTVQAAGEEEEGR